MAWDEKRAWVYLFCVVATTLAYAGYLAAQSTGDITAVPYGWPLLVAIVLSVVLTVVLSVGAAVTDPEQAARSDERDEAIGQWSDLMGSHVTAALMMGVLAAVVAEWDHFWIGNGIYGAFVVGTIAGTLLKLIRYRRGF